MGTAIASQDTYTLHAARIWNSGAEKVRRAMTDEPMSPLRESTAQSDLVS